MEGRNKEVKKERRSQGREVRKDKSTEETEQVFPTPSGSSATVLCVVQPGKVGYSPQTEMDKFLICLHVF